MNRYCNEYGRIQLIEQAKFSSIFFVLSMHFCFIAGKSERNGDEAKKYIKQFRIDEVVVEVLTLIIIIVALKWRRAHSAHI